jgi:hypothetical protein
MFLPSQGFQFSWSRMENGGALWIILRPQKSANAQASQASQKLAMLPNHVLHALVLKQNTILLEQVANLLFMLLNPA